jgi:hypothetical protein
VNALSYQPTSPTLSDVDCGVVATFAYTILYRGMGLRWHWYETTRRRILLAIVEECLSCVRKLLEGTSVLALAGAARYCVLQLHDAAKTVHCDPMYVTCYRAQVKVCCAHQYSDMLL